MENLAPNVDTEDEFESATRAKRVKVELEEEGDALASEEEETEEPEEDEGEDEGCPICFEQWTSTGFHRICSLRCGHLFGKRCIERWLSNGARTKCPQCNAPAKRTDIRVIYAKKLISAVDTSEKDALARQLHEERLAKRIAIEAEAKATVALQVALAELEKTKEELDALKKRLLHYAPDSEGRDSEEIPRFEYFQSFKLSSSPDACRCLDFDDYYATFLVSKADPSGKSFGICKISLLDKSVEYVRNLHTAMIRCITHSPFRDGLVLSTGNDQTLALTAMSSNTVLQTYSIPSAGWSCTFDPFDSNCLIAGLANGSIAIFDLRKTSTTPARLIEPALERKLPIHSLFMRKPNILIGATMDGPLGVDLESGLLLWSSKFDVQGACTSMSVDGNKMILSYRSSQMDLPAKCVVAELGDSGSIESHVIFETDSSQKVMSRCAILAADSTTTCFVPDEPTSSLHLYYCKEDTDKFDPYAKIETRSVHPLLDIKHGECFQHGRIVGALTGTDLYIFRKTLK